MRKIKKHDEISSEEFEIEMCNIEELQFLVEELLNSKFLFLPWKLYKAKKYHLEAQKRFDTLMTTKIKTKRYFK